MTEKEGRACLNLISILYRACCYAKPAILIDRALKTLLYLRSVSCAASASDDNSIRKSLSTKLMI
eukprot:IDg20320t1